MLLRWVYFIPPFLVIRYHAACFDWTSSVYSWKSKLQTRWILYMHYPKKHLWLSQASNLNLSLNNDALLFCYNDKEARDVDKSWYLSEHQLVVEPQIVCIDSGLQIDSDRSRFCALWAHKGSEGNQCGRVRGGSWSWLGWMCAILPICQCIWLCFCFKGVASVS